MAKRSQPSFIKAFPATGREVMVYEGPPTRPSSTSAARRRDPSLKSYLAAGAACIVSAGIVAFSIYEIWTGNALLNPIQLLFATELHNLFHLGLFTEAQEDFPRLFQALGIATTATLLGLSLKHAAHHWTKHVCQEVGREGTRALLLKLQGEFGAHCGLALIKFIKLCWKLLHKSGPSRASSH